MYDYIKPLLKKYPDNTIFRGGFRAAAISKMECFVIIVLVIIVNFYHKALHLGCCSSP